MDLQSRLIPALLLVLAVSAACCQQKTESKVFTQTTLPAPAGNFPGPQPLMYATAADGAAFSAPAESALPPGGAGARYFPSGTGMGILLFQTADDAGNHHLYASHFDGNEGITPAVELFCANQDASAQVDFGRASVLFLKSVTDREADALVLVPRLDLDDPGASDPDSNPNIRLYSSYFDYSQRESPVGSSPDLRWGFDTSIAAVDVSDTEDVGCVGIVTDGLAGSARFPSSAESEMFQGHQVTFAAVVWSQKASASSPERIWSRAFDLAGGSLGPAAEVPMDASATASDEAVVYGTATEIDSYGNVLFFVRTVSASSDQLLVAAVFDSSAGAFIASSHLLSPGPAPAALSALPPCQGQGRRIFGPDEGIYHVTGFFLADGYNVSGETSLMAFKIDPSDFTASGFDSSTGEDLAESDAGAGSSSPWSVQPQSAFWTMNRPGSCINLLFIQQRSESDATPALWARVLRTTAPGVTPRGLSQDLSIPLRIDSDAGALAVGGFAPPQDLQYMGFQTNPSAYTVAWKQDASGSVDTLRYNSITADLTPEPPVTPSLSRGASEGTVTFPDLTLDLASIRVTDGGGGGGSAGAAYIYYVRNAQTGTHESYRAFQLSTSTGVETNVGSLMLDPSADYQPREAVRIEVVTTPYNSDVAGSPDWPGSCQHIYLNEYRFLDSAGSKAWRTRRFLKDSTEAIPGDRFIPPASGSALAAAPDGIDAGVDRDAEPLFLGDYGSGACAFFRQGGNVFYNEFDPQGGSWYACATLVDNDGAGEGMPSDPAVFPQRYASAPSGYMKAVVLWPRTFPDGHHRLMIRPRY